MWNHGYDDYLVLGNSLFGAVKLIKNADINKYKYSGYGIRFDRGRNFSVPSGFGRNLIIFGADTSSSVHVVSEKKEFWFLVIVQHKD